MQDRPAHRIQTIRILCTVHHVERSGGSSLIVDRARRAQQTSKEAIINRAERNISRHLLSQNLESAPSNTTLPILFKSIQQQIKTLN